MVQCPSSLSRHSSYLSRLLLIDDDPASLNALSTTLHNYLGHFALETYSEPLHAVKHLADHRYDAVISDLQMPWLNGLQVAARLREVQPQTPFILMSGQAGTPFLAEAVRVGTISAFLPKPLDRAAFISTVRQALDLSRLLAIQKRREAIIKLNEDRLQKLLERYSQKGREWAWADPETRQQMEGFSERAKVYLSVLDKHLARTVRAHRRTTEELNAAHARLREHALALLRPR